MWQEPIFDRTNADTLTARAGQSTIEIHKGAINAEDLNRIEGNYHYVVDKLFENAMVVPHTRRNRAEITYEALEGPLGSFVLVNRLGRVSTDNYRNGVDDTAHTKYFDTTLKVSSSEGQYEASCPSIAKYPLDNAHKYYIRYEVYTEEVPEGTWGFACYFPIAEPAFFNGRFVTPGRWSIVSGVSGRNTFTNGEYQVRLDMDCNGQAQTAWFDGAMLIDLTECFGAGNEPTAAWCDQYIPFFEGTWTFTNTVKMVTRTYTNWQEQNIPWLSEINRIRNNFNSLVNLFLHDLNLPIFYSSPYLMYDEVNDWERVLPVGKEMYTNMQNEFRRCNAYVCGGSDVDWMPYEKNPVRSVVLGVGVLGKLMIGKEE